MSNTPSPMVVKVGGSLYDWPELRERLNGWLKCEAAGPALLVPGGGPLVDSLRALDRSHRLGDEAAHWLAMRALTVNAHFLLSLLPKASLVTRLDTCAGAWHSNQLAVLDPHAFAESDDPLDGSLPHTWEVGSDSIAARAAVRLGANRLILLKSADNPSHDDWSEASRVGYVDLWFERVIGTGLSVKAVNLRKWRPDGSRPQEPQPAGERDPGQ